MDIERISIDTINLSQRSKNALHRIGIHVVGDMLDQTRDSLLSVKNIGEKSITEILKMIQTYKDALIITNVARDEDSVDSSSLENIDEWINSDDGKNIIQWFFKENEITIDKIDYLDAKAYNLLTFNGYNYIYELINLSVDDLLEIPRMEKNLALDIKKVYKYYIKENINKIISCYADAHSEQANSKMNIFDYMKNAENKERVLEYVRANDCKIESLGLSNRPKNRLLMKGYQLLSEIIFLKRSDLQEIPSLGMTSIQEIEKVILDYLNTHESRIVSYISGDKSAIWDDDLIEKKILDLYKQKPFYGFSFNDFKENLQLQQTIPDDRLKHIIGKLIATKKVEYVDFRCYRVYEIFSDFLSQSKIDSRSRKMIEKRLQGYTLDEIGKYYGLSRERVRQIVKKYIDKVRNEYHSLMGVDYFDEDYYRYLYANYDIDKKVAEEWLGISQKVFHYMELIDIQKGKKDLKDALDDYGNIDVGLRLKIKNYLNRDKLFIDNRWVSKKRPFLEEIVAKRFCKENVSFDSFVKIYNDFLREQEVSYDKNIYYTDAVLRTRKHHLAEAKYLLWKQNEQMRYYDIEGHDYTELLDALNFSAFENIEMSTLKFVEEYPDLLDRYDIRDQYELHNLLRKILTEGCYNEFHCGRMPVICFGHFDRNAAIYELLKNNAPISQNDLCEMIHKEYGYDIAVIQGSYLKSFTQYYHNGMYVMDQKVMSDLEYDRLRSLLTEDFYYIDEIQKIYLDAVPDGDVDMINPYNLKKLGFIVLTKYAIQNYPSLEAYCEHILTCRDIIDISQYRKRFVYVPMFSQKLMELKRNLEIIEFEPNQIINISKLNISGVAKDDIHKFCSDVYNFVDNDEYFSIQKIKKSGFDSKLFDLGFSDWFYSNLLVSDERFSFGTMFGNLIFYTGNKKITIKSFEESIVRRERIIDTFDLINELTDVYGCIIKEKWDVIYKLQDTEVYYDKYLDRLYKDENTYNLEIEQIGGEY